jgi:hypothetical protein
MASLVFQAFDVPLTAAESMLGTIENMKFFLRTGFGNSTGFAGGGISVKTQVGLSSASAYSTHTGKRATGQNSLIATGGALKPEKCFYSIISFEWRDGVWRYAANKSKLELGISVPLPGGGSAGIEHKLAQHAKKTLGAMSSPDGNSRAAIMMIQDKAQKWVNDVQNGKLHRHNVWFSMKCQLVPRIVFGLCSSTASFDDLSNALRKQYYQILPPGGVVRTANINSRMIAPGFFGIGLPHLGVEALVAMSNKLLMHYGCDTAMGNFMRASHSLFLLELGISTQPLQESYEKYSFLSTHSWMKMLWEKLSMFGVQMIISDGELMYPREDNRFLMQVLIEKGYSWEILLRLN